MSQEKYAPNVLQKAGMLTCKPALTPISVQKNLSDSEDPLFPNPRLYWSITGALQYITITRLDLAYAVNWVCQFIHKPRESHFIVVKRILRYLRGKVHFGLNYTSGPLIIHAYSDSDWAGDHLGRRSTSGYCFYMGPNPILWSAKKQTSVTILHRVRI